MAQAAWSLKRGKLLHFARLGTTEIQLPIAPISAIAKVGPVHRLVGSPTDTPRGAFRIRPLQSRAPSYPVLWAHDNSRERHLIVSPDSEGLPADREATPKIWATATRAHYNADLRFNSQSLIVAMTERRCLGGRAWPSVIFEDPEHEYAFALWCNSTLGLLMHWWVANKTQSGRGSTTVRRIPNIPTLDTRSLTAEQRAAAKSAFEAMRERRFLPFDQIDEDPSRAELDQRLLIDVLGLPPSLCDAGGPLDLLRRKLAGEPQIHGGKRTRVVFYETVADDGAAIVRERPEQRGDRR